MRISVAEKAANYVLLIGFSLFAIAPVAGIFSTALSPQNGVAEGGHSLQHTHDVAGDGVVDLALRHLDAGAAEQFVRPQLTREGH